MMWLEILLIVLAVAVLVLIAMWVVSARRLDALHRGVIQSRVAACDALAVRSATAERLANANILDAAGSVLLAEAAHHARSLSHTPIVEDGLEGPPRALGDVPDRREVESNLSRTLRAVLAGLDVADLTDEERELLEQLETSRSAVRISRRMHNSRVDQVRRLRSRFLVGVLRMAGTAALPQPVDLDDD